MRALAFGCLAARVVERIKDAALSRGMMVRAAPGNDGGGIFAVARVSRGADEADRGAQGHHSALAHPVLAGLGVQDALDDLRVFDGDGAELAKRNGFQLNRPAFQLEEVGADITDSSCGVAETGYDELLTQFRTVPRLDAFMERVKIHDTFGDVADLPILVPIALVTDRLLGRLALSERPHGSPTSHIDAATHGDRDDLQDEPKGDGQHLSLPVVVGWLAKRPARMVVAPVGAGSRADDALKKAVAVHAAAWAR